MVSRDLVTTVQQHLDDLVVVTMSGQDDRGHVGRERAARHRRRLAVLAEESLHTNPFHLLVKVKESMDVWATRRFSESSIIKAKMRKLALTRAPDP